MDMGADRKMVWKVYCRSQKSRGSGLGQWGGPDTYVAVVGMPEGVEFPRYANRKVIRDRGGVYEWIGEGYSRYCGPRSSLGQALARAKRIMATRNQTV